MGNYRFRLSDMMPNAWFYKLKDMSRTRNQTTKRKPLPPPIHHHIQPRHSFYFAGEPNRPENLSYTKPTNPKATDTRFPPDPPRKSSTKNRERRRRRQSTSKGQSIYSPSVSTRAHHHPSSSSSDNSPLSEFKSDNVDDSIPQSLCTCRFTSSDADIIIDVNRRSYFEELQKLAPIQTKPPKHNELVSIKIVQEEEQIKTRKETKSGSVVRKSVSYSAGLKLRPTAPKFSGKKIQGHGRRSVGKKGFSPGLAIVKSSVDPEKDFRESMVEMILEKNVRGKKELEELLACYLSLNSDEYHHLIVKAFEQIWFDLPNSLHL